MTQLLRGDMNNLLEGQPLALDLALRWAELPGAEVMDLVALAHAVQLRFSPDPHICTIMNVKSGACSENCKFCAQSTHHTADAPVYPLLDEETILADCERAHQNHVRHFGLVTSGLGYTRPNAEWDALLKTVRSIRQRFPDMAVCLSCGLLGPDTAAAAAEAGVSCYNINLQVNPDHYSRWVATTHRVEDRIRTIRLLQQQGVKICSGGILGLGESMLDRVRLALALRDLHVDVIPLNVLIPILGTALENQPPVAAVDVAKTFALFRLIHPQAVIKFAAGRETRMKDFQALLLLAGANGFLTGGYLTTRGRDTGEDWALHREVLGFGPSPQHSSGTEEPACTTNPKP